MFSKIFIFLSLVFDLRKCPKRSETTPNRFRRSLMGLKITFIFSKNLDFSTILQCFRTPNTHSFTLGIGLVRYPNHRAHQNPVRIVLREGRSILKPNLRSRGDWHILLPTRQTAPARSIGRYVYLRTGLKRTLGKRGTDRKAPSARQIVITRVPCPIPPPCSNMYPNKGGDRTTFWEDFPKFRRFFRKLFYLRIFS